MAKFVKEWMSLCVTSAEFHFSIEIEEEIQIFEIKIAAPNWVLPKVPRVSGNTAGRQIGLVSYYHNVCWQLNPLDILALWARWVFHVFLSVLVNKLCINLVVALQGWTQKYLETQIRDTFLLFQFSWKMRLI